MDKKTAQLLIEKTFNNAFNEEQFTFFAKNLLNDLEPKNNFYTGNLIWDDYKEHINTYKRIGKYVDPDGEALDVLIVEVKSLTKLERARTALRNFAIKHLGKFEKDYALVAFYSKEDGGADWRFSFIKLEYRSELDEEKGKVKLKKEFTPAKRYSFLVGKHEKAHTAKNQLLPLLQNIANNPTIEELEAAFSIEKVTDEFFSQYKDLYLKLYEHFENDRHVKSAIELAKIDNTRFTKKLLGQIVFLYFLQKKGWLGVPQNERWGTGKKRFVQELFNQAKAERVNFFKDKLQYLFYEALAKERDNANSYYERFDCRIPFLNGGLFEADYDWQNANITIPESLFRNEEKNKAGDVGTGVLDVFDRYNFTIKEDEPLDKEVAVDPEMLGKVFENMLDITERKSKGAFYTPREIVHYMCQESLIHYLDNALGERVEKKDIETFIREGHFALENDERVAAKGETKTYKYQLPEGIRQNADLIDRKLIDIRICDPAIGSGAFPVGLLHELVNAMLVLKPHLSCDYLTDKLKNFGFEHRESVSDSRYIYRLKRHVIQESIYGVDIDASAIDIARLRLWLSLVVDEDDLDPIETLPNLDYKIVCGNSLIGLPDGAMKDLTVEAELEKLKERFYNITDDTQKKNLRKLINTKIRELLDSAEQFAGYKIGFDFKLFFSQVWREKGGFDVVIGNPPYIQISKLEEPLKSTLSKMKFETFSSSGDIYELFYENGNRVLTKGGHLCFITSNKWLRANYGTSTRKYFLAKTNPKLLFDFGQEMIFSSAIVHSNILLFQNGTFKNEFIGCQLSKAKLNSLVQYFSDNAICLDYFSEEEVWSISTPELINIKSGLEKKAIKLKKWNIGFYRGILTGFNEAFIIDETKKKELLEEEPSLSELIKPILRGRDTRRYYCNYHSLYLINTHNGDKKRRLKKVEVPKNFPILFDYLNSFPSAIKTRADKGDHWTNLRNCAFLEEVEKDKIIFSEIVSEPQFYYDTQKYYPEATAFLITGENLKWLTAFLNSELITVLFRIFYAGGELVGKYRYKKAFLENLPIPEPHKSYNSIIEKLVDYLSLYKGVFKDKSKNFPVATYFESVVDGLVYEIVFSEEICSAGKEILKHLGDLKPITDGMSEEEKLAIIQSEFERLYDPNHPVRFAIETLDSVEEVRIIKEALK